MTKLFKKFFIATLSFVMMIACAFTFTTYKASASSFTISSGEISSYAQQAYPSSSVQGMLPCYQVMEDC